MRRGAGWALARCGRGQDVAGLPGAVRRCAGWALALLIGAAPTAARGQELVSFPTPDGGIVYADSFGGGEHTVVLAHGGRFTKESWAPQIPELVAAGLGVLAIDFRGRGQSRGPQGSTEQEYYDVMAAVEYARANGAETVSVVGGSFGGWAASLASIELPPGAIDRLVLLAASPIDEPERIGGTKLFIVARDDPYFGGGRRLDDIRGQYERAAEPKELVVLEGNEHAQFIFEGPQGPRLMREILRFLTAEQAGAGPRTLDYSQSMALEPAAETSANARFGDLDNDGDLDIVLAKGRHWPLANQVLMNDGDGGFEQRYGAPGSADRTYAAALSDLDGDGDLDLVVGNDRPDEKRVYHNDGDGRLTLAGTFGDPEWPTRNVTVADLNGDDRAEIIVANRGGPENRSVNYVCVNNGRGQFERCFELSNQSATTIAAGDLTGDGHIDLFVPHRDGGQSFLHVNDGSGNFDETRPVGPDAAATRAVTLGDLDGNGALDIIMGAPQGGAHIYLNAGGGRFADPVAVGAARDVAYSMAVADLDADGDDDLVIGNRGAESTVLVNDGTGRAFARIGFGDAQGAVYGLAIGDANGDDILDIVAARSDARNTLYWGRYSSRTTPRSPASGSRSPRR